MPQLNETNFKGVFQYIIRTVSRPSGLSLKRMRFDVILRIIMSHCDSLGVLSSSPHRFHEDWLVHSQVQFLLPSYADTMALLTILRWLHSSKKQQFT